MNTKEKVIPCKPTGICINTGSRVKTRVKDETDERTGLHQEDGRQRAS